MPLLTAVFGYLLLGETLNLLEKLSMIVSFAGVAIMVSGGSNTPTKNYTVFAISALLLNPIMNSLVSILLRQSRGFSMHTQAFYQAFFLMVGWSLYLLIIGEDFAFLDEFTFQSYFFLIAGAFINLINQFSR